MAISAQPPGDPYLGASDTPAAPAPAAAPSPAPDPELPKPPASRGWVKWVVAAVALLIVAAGILVWLQQRSRPQSVQAGDFAQQHVPLDKLEVTAPAAAVTSLKVNGNLQVASSIALVPTTAPDKPVAGQIYYDKATNRPLIYDGTQFVVLQGGGNSQVTNNNNTFVTNNAGDTINNTTVVQGSSGNATANGTTGALALFTGTSTLGSSLITQAGQGLNINTNANPANTVSIDAGTGPAAIQIGNSASGHDIQIGTGAGTQTVTAGSGSGASATTVQGGTGGASLITGNAAGVTGNINIKTGDSSTTASGNITIDSGTGILDGQVVSQRSFESGTENIQDWFNTTVAQTTDQAHDGVSSLEITPSSNFWGIIEDNNSPGTAVVPGHQYFFSFWVRAKTSPRNIAITLDWSGAGVSTPLNVITDNATGWTQATILITAPAGATVVRFHAGTSTGAAGDVHYFDDITITDLSSASAFSAISIGETNAKVVTIGNLNEIAATSIFGGSGINLNAGAGSLTQTGGVVNITGNAASSFVTSGGALTLTGAATSTWSIAEATNGVGGDLTIHAGDGTTGGNNDGGDLILQGGGHHGTGLEGSVIVQPRNDSTDAFQIQSTAGTPLLTADTTGMQISVTGTASAFAKLTLANAHFTSTQTNPPTIGTPANCGATPTAAVTAGSTDSAGSFTITTGTGGTSSTCDTTFTFNQPYGAAPKSIVVVGKSDTASAQRQIYVVSSNATSFNTSFAASAAGADNTTYSFSYWVIE